MSHDLDDFSLSARSDLAIESFAKIDSSTYKLPSPPLITNAVAPEILPCKRRVRLDAITDETTSRVGVHGQKERDEKMMRVPEGLVALLSDLCMRSGEHQQHA